MVGFSIDNIIKMSKIMFSESAALLFNRSLIGKLLKIVDHPEGVNNDEINHSVLINR